MNFTHFQPWFIQVFRVFYMYSDPFQGNYRFKYLLEENDVFEDIWRLFELCSKQRMSRLLSQNVDRRSPRIINRRWVVTIDRQRSHPRVKDKLEDSKFNKSSNIYIFSPWPPVRLIYQVFFFHFRGRLAQRPFRPSLKRSNQPPLERKLRIGEREI